jgi:hypothetical protein
MTADLTTIKKVRSYFQRIPAPKFLGGMFVAAPENFHNAEKVEWDINRDDEKVAVPVGADVGNGYRRNESGSYTTKDAPPPVYKEMETIDAYSLLERSFGDTTYDDRAFQQRGTSKALLAAERLRKKIERAIELQASQILQTGKLSLTDSAGKVLYDLDFKPKTAHFPTAGAGGYGPTWATPAGSTPIADMILLANTIRDNSGEDPKRIVMGESAFENAMQNTAWKERFDLRRAELGQMNPMAVGGTRGGNFRGTVEVGNYKVDVWTYGARYDSITSPGTKIQYIGADNVTMLTDAPLDKHFGGLPNFGTDGRALRFLPRRIARNGMDFNFVSWISPNGQELNIGVGSRPLLVPTAIDGFGTLDTTP